LLAAVDLAGALRPLQAWEAEHAVTIARGEALRRETTIDARPPPEYVGRIIADIERAKKTLPPPIPLAHVLRAVDVLSEARWQPLQRAAVRLLAALPATERPAIRPHFLVHAAATTTNEDTHEKTARLWEALAAELSAGADARLLGPWSGVFESGAIAAWLEY